MRRVFLVACFAVLAARPAAAQRTDVVVLDNGDHITGENKELTAGRLSFKTDNLGTVSIEWDTILSITATRLFELETGDGQLYLSQLLPAPSGQVVVTVDSGVATLDLLAVVRLQKPRAARQRTCR
jgi:hypothetical protein